MNLSVNIFWFLAVLMGYTQFGYSQNIDSDELDLTSTEIQSELNSEIELENQEWGENLKLESDQTTSRSPDNEDDEEFGPEPDSIDEDILASLDDEGEELSPRSKEKNSLNNKSNYQATPQAFQKGDKLINHPNARKGLYRITKDRDYLYKIPKSEQKHSASLRFGMFDPTNLQTEDRQFNFSDLYEETEGPMLLIDYEWQIRFLGKLSIKAGSGFYFAQGNGRFNSSTAPPDLVPLEDFSLFMFPNSFDLVYRLQFWDNQPLVPFASAGVDLFTFMEMVDGGGFPKLGGSVGGHFALGGAFNINFLDRWSLLQLDREYGINSVWLTAEYRNYFHITGAFDFSGSMFNGGIAVDF